MVMWEISDGLDNYKEDQCSNNRKPNAYGGHHSLLAATSSLQPLSNRNHNLLTRISVETWENSLNVGIGKTRIKDKADRATVEQAIDPRTLRALLKMINNKEFDFIYGCISTGKEANVYYAVKSDGQELAVKIYKTSVLKFKNRTQYVKGDYRFGYLEGHCKGNPRRMVKAWADKERRNLERLKTAGIRCPTPFHLRNNILVMEFIGKACDAAPRLKDAKLSLDKQRKFYMEIIIAMRTLYQNCNIVHADLSEYNILVFEGHLYIIDVSQSVEIDHPKALEFLVKDCFNVSGFFKKHGVAVMLLQELFDFIVDRSITDETIDSYLEKVEKNILARGDVISYEDEMADLVFSQAYISKTLDSVNNIEEDIDRITSGKDTSDMYYQTITGLKQALSIAEHLKGCNLNDSGTDGATDDATDESDSDGNEEISSDSGGHGKLLKNGLQAPFDGKADKKENKKKVKEEKRESRKSKVPKALKKKKKKLGKAKKNR